LNSRRSIESASKNAAREILLIVNRNTKIAKTAHDRAPRLIRNIARSGITSAREVSAVDLDAERSWKFESESKLNPPDIKMTRKAESTIACGNHAAGRKFSVATRIDRKINIPSLGVVNSDLTRRPHNKSVYPTRKKNERRTIE
jgi:hypothetical protein